MTTTARQTADRPTTTTAPPLTTTERTPWKGALLLLAAAWLWGLGFYAQRVSVAAMTPLWATSARMVLAVPLALAVLVHRGRRGAVVPWRAGIVCGVLLYAAFALQTVAMLHTPVSRVALLTGLYGVLTPLLQPFFGLRRPGPLQLLAVGVAMAGTVLLCGVLADEHALTVAPNVGDAMTLVMALVSAFYLIFIARIADRADMMAFNGVQLLAMAAASVVVAVVAEPLPGALDAAAWASVLYLAVGSSFLAFQLQLFGQRHVSPAAAGVLMLLETPIGVGSAVLLLGERMTTLQWAGAACAVTAVLLAVLAEHRQQGGAAAATGR